jgi:hypothetical protein
MKKSLFALLLLAFTADFLVQFPARVLAGPAEDVQAAMQLLKSKAATFHVPHASGCRNRCAFRRRAEVQYSFCNDRTST